MIEMREFGADTTEIVPDACENGLDSQCAFIRKLETAGTGRHEED
jgi:hypothetical protein